MIGWLRSHRGVQPRSRERPFALDRSGRKTKVPGSFLCAEAHDETELDDLRRAGERIRQLRERNIQALKRSFHTVRWVRLDTKPLSRGTVGARGRQRRDRATARSVALEFPRDGPHRAVATADLSTSVSRRCRGNPSCRAAGSTSRARGDAMPDTTASRRAWSRVGFR